MNKQASPSHDACWKSVFFYRFLVGECKEEAQGTVCVSTNDACVFLGSNHRRTHEHKLIAMHYTTARRFLKAARLKEQAMGYQHAEMAMRRSARQWWDEAEVLRSFRRRNATQHDDAIQRQYDTLNFWREQLFRQRAKQCFKEAEALMRRKNKLRDYARRVICRIRKRESGVQVFRCSV